MLRRRIKAGISAALYGTGADRAIGRLAGIRNIPLVICYHRAVEDVAASARSSDAPMLISRRMLERHLDWVGLRFRLVSLEELGLRVESQGTFDRPVAAVTFDDGYSDVYTNAFPLLKRKGIPAAVFVVTDLTGTSNLHTHDKLYLLLAGAFSKWQSPARPLADLLCNSGMTLPDIQKASHWVTSPSMAMRWLVRALPQAAIRRVIETLEVEVRVDEGAVKELRPLSWEMVSEMHRAGMTIGSHTRSHALLTKESLETVVDETAGSRALLERKLGVAVRHFAYPDGRFSSTIVAAVAAAGDRFAYTTCQHRDAVHPLLTIPRKALWENSCLDALGHFSSAIMSCQVNGLFDFVAGCRQDHSA